MLSEEPANVDFQAIRQQVEESIPLLKGRTRTSVDVDPEFAGAVGAACLGRHVDRAPEVLSPAYGFFKPIPHLHTNDSFWTNQERWEYDVLLEHDPFRYPYLGFEETWSKESRLHGFHTEC